MPIWWSLLLNYIFKTLYLLHVVLETKDQRFLDLKLSLKEFNKHKKLYKKLFLILQLKQKVKTFILTNLIKPNNIKNSLKIICSRVKSQNIKKML